MGGLEAKQSELEAKLAAQAERYTQLESTTTAELEAKQSELEAKQSELATCKNSIKTCEKRIADIQDYSDKGIGKCEADKHRERSEAEDLRYRLGKMTVEKGHENGKCQAEKEDLRFRLGKMTVENGKCQAEKEAVVKAKERCWC